MVSDQTTRPQVAGTGVHGHRIHHHVRWGNVAPKIISDVYRKPREDAPKPG